MGDLFTQLCHYFSAEPDRRGECWATCVHCGKEGKHFSFSERANGYHCFVCNASGSLSQLAEHLRLDTPSAGSGQAYTPPVHRPTPAPRPIARWRTNPDKLLAEYQNHSQRYAYWNRYKPLEPATVDSYGLGVGRLPFQREDGSWRLSTSLWLTVPLYENGELVALRGRNMKPDGSPKWISASGSQYTLAFADRVRPGSVCWVCENYIDALLVMQSVPEWSAVATGGVSWRDEWAEWLAERKPEVVVVALDNDLPGQATGEFRQRLERQWIAERGTQPPAANGPKIANSLLRAGVRTTLFEWPEWCPEKCDIGWLLMQAERKVAA